jgi:hypothetical protein
MCNSDAEIQIEIIAWKAPGRDEKMTNVTGKLRYEEACICVCVCERIYM